MAEALILDSEAVNALARSSRRGVLEDRALAILSLAHDRRALVRVPAPVLAEVCKGPRFDAAVNHLLNDRGIAVLELTRKIAQQAGALLTEARMSSVNAVDAFVVASALEFAAALVATGDPKDIRRLAARHPSVSVFSI
ncbi:MAG TPA: PIN domain-containing protein [Polyangiaceae bacterium]|nr:PIN domain-containing protein [Polyangiaceae bacterium]